MNYPVPFEQRVDKASGIVLGYLKSQHCYIGPTGSINTLNIFQVEAWLKNNTGAEEIAIITFGGVLGDRATIVSPALQLESYNDYILFLDGDNQEQDDKAWRAQHPDMLQAVTYADAQGALTGQFGFYHDLLVEPRRDEAGTFARIQSLTGQEITTPSGEIFLPREWHGDQNKMMPITGFAPSPTRAGTIVAGDFITITGSGFGAAAGTVFYTNADDGGATFTSSGIASDNTAWADGSITNKVARRAGTGPINVNGAMMSGSNLTVNYAHLDINSSFSGFGVTTRQRYYHRNLNGAGGIYFLYNTTSGMSANAPAVAAAERALQTWRCATFINWFSNGTTATGVSGVDGNNVILFDGTLPAGVLGQAVSNFSGSATGACNLANTVWWVADIDIRMFPDPPTAGFPWEYGPAAPAFSEYDFESVMVHELGHAHGLGHVISAGAVMHFAIANGSTSRVLSANDIAGGTARMAYSTAATCFNPVGSGTQMTALTAGTCILSVVMADLQGEYVPGKGNVLNWQTWAETNNVGFVVERSTNGADYEPLDFVMGNGSTQKATSYSYTDETADLPELCFYRLRQVDIDGNFGYTEVVQVRRTYPLVTGIQSDGLNQELLVSLSPTLESCTFTLYDLSGRKLLTQVLVPGQNTVPVSGLPAGAYLWRAVAGTSMADGKILLGL